jgi:hypothetical protein
MMHEQEIREARQGTLLYEKKSLPGGRLFLYFILNYPLGLVNMFLLAGGTFSSVAFFFTSPLM